MRRLVTVSGLLVALLGCGTTSSPGPAAHATASVSPAVARPSPSPTPAESFALPAASATIDGTLRISGSAINLAVHTNFPAFKSHFYIATVLVTLPTGETANPPKCDTVGTCRFDSDDFSDTVQCIGSCPTGDYSLVINIYSHSDALRAAQSTSYVLWVGGESGASLFGNPLARGDPEHPDGQYLRKVVYITY